MIQNLFHLHIVSTIFVTLVIVLVLFLITHLVNTTGLGTEPLAEQHIWDLAVLWPLEEPPSAATGCNRY